MTNITSHGAIAVNIMHILRGGFTHCRQEDDEQLDVCDYHRDRCNCRIVGITDGGGVPTSTFKDHRVQDRLNMTPQVRELLERMAADFDVAGGWYLVQQQREWLEAHVADILQQRRGEPCRILVSGIAGYAHFFSYLKILLQASLKAGYDPHLLDIDVIDLCPTPLLEIQHVYTNLAQPMSAWMPRTVRLKGLTFRPSYHNQRFIHQVASQISYGQIHPFCASVDHLPDACGHYDIITEHFLISMMERERPQIKASRESYRKVTKPAGHLLMASGFPKEQFVDELIDLHSKLGFMCSKDELVKVWDPFGLSRGTISQMLQNTGTAPYVPLDNVMADFTFTP